MLNETETIERLIQDRPQGIASRSGRGGLKGGENPQKETHFLVGWPFTCMAGLQAAGTWRSLGKQRHSKGTAAAAGKTGQGSVPPDLPSGSG
jgi:hypothetical protein